VIIEAGLIIIGILALIAAFFLVRDKAKTSETSQQAMPKQVANKQTVTLAEPSASAKPESVLLPGSTADEQPTVFAKPLASAKTEELFPVPQVPFPTSTTNKQTVALAEEPLGSARTQVSFPVPQAPFPTSTVNRQTVTLAEEPSASTQTHTLTKTSLLVQDAPITQTPAHEIQPIQTPVQQAEADQIQAPVVPNWQQPTNKTFPETHMPVSILSETIPLPPSDTESGSLIHSPSVDQQIAELISDTWALQQQAAEIGRRLNYLSTYIQHSTASTSDGRDTNSKG
jgi:hypothetical protein